jgi:hypothetical protein
MWHDSRFGGAMLPSWTLKILKIVKTLKNSNVGYLDVLEVLEILDVLADGTPEAVVRGAFCALRQWHNIEENNRRRLDAHAITDDAQHRFHAAGPKRQMPGFQGQSPRCSTHRGASQANQGENCGSPAACP